jgi:hypothetical protein
VLLQRLAFVSGQPIWNPELQREEHAEYFRDPFLQTLTPLSAEGFQKAAQLVIFHDATYIVLCPGATDKLRDLAEHAGITWKNTPFVADSEDLAITMDLATDEDMRLNSGQAIPAIMEFDGVNHIVDYGRG